MALGGGVFVTQNKKLPGSYINFVSVNKASTVLGERGTVALPLIMDWGKSGEVITVTSDTLRQDSLGVFGHNYTDKAMLPLREVFKNAIKVYIYRLNEGTKASNTYATALYGGERGNDFKLLIEKNADNDAKFDVQTLLDNKVVDTQTVATASELKANKYLSFKNDAELSITETAGMPLTGGENGTVTGDNWQKALDVLEGYSFNVLGIASTDKAVKDLAVFFTKRLRDEVGIKFQTVLYDCDANDKGIINVVNKIKGEDKGTESAKLVYWVTGAQGGCAVNKSCTNKIYDGELEIDTGYTQVQLEDAINAGKFIMHKVGDDVRVLTDINSKVTTSDEEGEDFKSNQTIRVIDQIANDIATIFNTKYLGVIPNDTAGRVSLWSDIVAHHKHLQTIRAIENFDSGDVVVTQGETKKIVLVNDKVTPTNAMEQLYMTVVVA